MDFDIPSNSCRPEGSAAALCNSAAHSLTYSLVLSSDPPFLRDNECVPAGEGGREGRMGGTVTKGRLQDGKAEQGRPCGRGAAYLIITPP